MFWILSPNYCSDPLEAMIETRIGFQLKPFFRLAYHHIKEVERKSNEEFKKFRKILMSKKVSQLLNAYYREFPTAGKDLQEAISYFESKNIDLEGAKTTVMNDASLYSFHLFMFTAEEFAAGSVNGDKLTQLKATLDALAFSFGDLRGTDAEHFFMDNPCWGRPLMKLDETKYFLPIVTLPFSFPFEAIENLLSKDKDVLSAYFERRGKFLEERVAALFKETFVEAKVYQGNLWIDPATGEQFENDILVVIDCYAVVVEAKGGRVTGPARRGALPRLGRTVQELIQASSEQSQRFADFIASVKGEVIFNTKHSLKNIVDLSGVSRIVRLNVLLDDIAAIQSTAVELQKAGFISNSIKLPPTMTLADLEVVVDVLDSPAKFLHYLMRREEFEHNTDLIADELDFLGFYLDTGFNIGELEFDGSRLVLSDWSQKIDDFYTPRLNGRRTTKPLLKLTRWWEDIISKLEERATPNWLHLAVKLLSVSFEDQKQAKRQFNEVKKNVGRNWRDPRHSNMVLLCTGPSKRRDGYVFLAYRTCDADKRHVWASEGAASLIEKFNITEVLSIGFNIDKRQYPYSFVGLLA